MSTLKKYPVAAYYLLTFLISWGGVVIMLGDPGRITARPGPIPFLPLYFITVAGPSISGLILTGVLHGRQGYRRFLTALIKWRVPINWYAVAILAAPVTVIASLLTLELFSPAFTPGLLSPGTNPVAASFGIPGDDKLLLVLFVMAIGLFNGFVEELGWTGFATPDLTAQWNWSRAGFSLGLVWGAWHFLGNFLGSAEGAGTVPLPLYLGVLLFSFLPPFRMLMVWVYANTSSLLLAMIMHASLNVFWILLMPVSLNGSELMVWYTLWALFLWALVFLVRKYGSEGVPQNIPSAGHSKKEPIRNAGMTERLSHHARTTNT